MSAFIFCSELFSRRDTLEPHSLFPKPRNIFYFYFFPSTDLKSCINASCFFFQDFLLFSVGKMDAGEENSKNYLEIKTSATLRTLNSTRLNSHSVTCVLCFVPQLCLECRNSVSHTQRTFVTFSYTCTYSLVSARQLNLLNIRNDFK
jgi:hypothetical protein